jgi:hypothetical protein
MQNSFEALERWKNWLALEFRMVNLVSGSLDDEQFASPFV